MKPLVYAHRGSHLGFCRENSLPAFQEAEAMGADGVETDLRETADGRIVLFHDDTVRGRPVETMSVEDLGRAVSMRVPTIEDVLDRSWHVRWNFEIKTQAAWNLLRPLLTALPAGTLVTSFIHRIAVEASRDAKLEAGILTASAPMLVPAASGTLATCVHDARTLDAEAASAWHSRGWDLGVYAVAGERRHREAMSLRPALVITDEVSLALRLRDRIPS